MATKQQIKDQERDEAIARLRDVFGIKPGSTLYTSVQHVSRSGMSRQIEVYAVKDGEIVDITWLVARALGEKVHERGGIVVSGCGFDTGFDVVYRLGRKLYPQGFRCAGSKCPSNDHVNPRCRGEYNYETREYDGYIGPMARDGKSKHRGDGGYALNHRWL